MVAAVAVTGAAGPCIPAAVAQPRSGASVASAEVDLRPDALLSTELARLVRTVSATPIPTPRGLRAGLAMAELATEVAPEDPNNWRLLLLAARLAEDDAAIARALDELGRLVPEDDVVTLARMQAAIEARGRTVEDRAEFLEFLVQAGRDGRLDAAVASRMAFELALLRQRSGDLDGFAESLLDSLEFDPSHVAAARTVLDFFSANARGPVDRAELLVNLILADPTDPVVLEQLSRLLLREGAYESAARMYAIAVDVLSGGSAARQDVAEDLIADQALAMWASGDVDSALRAIEDRERFKQDMLQVERERRRRAEELEPGSTDDLEPIPARAPLGLNLDSVRLAILAVEGPSVTLDVPAGRSVVQRAPGAATGDGADPAGGTTEPAIPRRGPRLSPAEQHAALLATLRAELDARYDAAVDEADAVDGTGFLGVQRRLEHAWAAATLFENAETARRRVAEVEELVGLTEAAAARFEGWIRMREGDATGAIDILRPVADADPLARLGLALALEAAGDAAAARVELRGVAVAARGTMPGVIAIRRLQVEHGETIQPSATAARLEGLLSTVPVTLDRLAWNQTGSLRLRTDFRQRRIGPYEPVILDITIVNNSPVAMALDPRGPVVPTLLLMPEVTLATGALPPRAIVIDLHRTLRLEPRERLTVSIDLQRTELGSLLNGAVEIGASIRVEAFLNHDVASAGPDRRPIFYPRPIAADSQSGFLRVDGVELVETLPDGSIRRSAEVDAMIRAVDQFRGRESGMIAPAVVGAVNRMALVQMTADTDPVFIGIRRDAGIAMVGAFPLLDPVMQAWIIATSPVGASLPQYRAIVAASDDVALRAVWMITKTGQVDDPVLLGSLASEDPRLRVIAEAVDERLRRVELGP
jgi:hypothetical protein